MGYVRGTPREVLSIRVMPKDNHEEILDECLHGHAWGQQKLYRKIGIIVTRPIHGDRDEVTGGHSTGTLLQAHEHLLMGKPAATLPRMRQQVVTREIVTPG